MFGFRPDGKKVKDIDPIQRIIPHIMPTRNDAQNMTEYDCPCEPLDAFIIEQSDKGVEYTYMHLIIAAMVRVYARFPRLNRFVINGRIFQHNEIQVSFVVKKDLSPDAPDALVKLNFTGMETLQEVQQKIDEAIEANNNIEANNGTDKLARLITMTPNFLIKLTVGLIKLLDKHGMLPKAILNLSPFHTSLFITNLKSIKGPSIFHHLYNFGTTGIFMAMGKESEVPVVNADGKIVVGKRMPVQIVTDERFCDGFYFVSAMKFWERLLKHPTQMMMPPEALSEDVKVIFGRKAREMAQQQKQA
ncbi:MAG: 2-oxo acid dehydrogenase subunit E2 [Bacteroidales bacterium]|nr:2-oxo acid dehydrogenase subunit E2 [Bacteroidales bacterium]